MHRFLSALSHTPKSLAIRWKVSTEAKESVFGHIWLQDSTRQLLQKNHAYPLEHLDHVKNDRLIKQCSMEGTQVGVHWSDDTKDEYPALWLAAHDPKLINVPKDRKKLWSPAEFKVHEVPFGSKNQQKEIMENLEVSGIVAVTNVPTSDNREANERMVERVLNQIGQINRRYHPTNVNVFSTYTSSSDVNVGPAHTRDRLNFHTDHLYYNMPAKVVGLFCAECNNDSFRNTFLDGWYVAKEFKKSHPHYYSILATKSIAVGRLRYAIEEEMPPDRTIDEYRWTKYHRAKVINENEDGSMERISFRVTGRATEEHMNDEELWEYYQAYRAFDKCLSEHASKYFVKSGTVMILDNHRVMHGRVALPPDFRRRLFVAWVPLEVYLSRERLLLEDQLVSTLDTKWLVGNSTQTLKRMVELNKMWSSIG